MWDSVGGADFRASWHMIEQRRNLECVSPGRRPLRTHHNQAEHPAMPESRNLAAPLDALVREVISLALSAGIEPGRPWSLGEAGVFGKFPTKNFQEAALNCAQVLEAVSRGGPPMFGGVPIKWGARELRGYEKLGLLLLLGMSSATREDSTEGTVWPHVRSSPIMELFRLGGLDMNVLIERPPDQPERAVPTDTTKKLIEHAVKALNLRNALDVERVHKWVLTLNLQFGIPVKAFRQRGAEWLRGAGRPQAVEYLLGEKLLGKIDASSTTFKQTWREIKAVFRGRHDPKTGAGRIAELQWACGSDWKKMLDEAAEFNFGLDAADVEELALLTRSDPHLHFDATGPRWLVGISIPEADSNGLADDVLAIVADGRPVGRIERGEETGPDESWRGIELPSEFPSLNLTPTWIRMPLTVGPWREIHAARVGTQDHVFSFPLCATQLDRCDEPLLLQAWADDYWVPCDQSTASGDYMIALPPALRDAHSNWISIATAGLQPDQNSMAWTLRRVRANGNPLELRLDGQLVWTFDPIGGRRPDAFASPKLEQCLAQDGSVELRIDSPTGATIESLFDEERGSSIPLGVNNCRIPLHHFEPRYEGESARSAFVVRVSVRMGDRRRTVRKKVRYPRAHFAIETASGTRRHPDGETLHLTEFATPRLVGATNRGDGMTPFIFEGTSPRCRAAGLTNPSGRRNALTTLADGGALVLFGDLVNLNVAGGRQRLASGTINVGAFTGCPPRFDGGDCCMRSARPGLAPDESWCLELLTTEGREIRSFAMHQPQSQEDEWLRARFESAICPDECIAVRLVIGRRVRGLWQLPNAVLKLVPQIDSRSRWLTMLLWELLPPPADSEQWQEFAKLFRVEPNWILTPPDEFNLEATPESLADLDERHFSLIELLSERLKGTAEDAHIIKHIHANMDAVPTRGEFSELGCRLASAVRYSPLFAAILMNARDDADHISSRSGIWARRRDAVARQIRVTDDGRPKPVDTLIDLATGPGSVLAGLFPGAGGGIDPQFVLQNIEAARTAFRGAQFSAPAIANLRILCNMTRGEGHIARALASRLIEP